MIRVINRYLLGDFAKSFLIALVLLTFVMYVGAVVKAIDYVAKGIPGLVVLKIFSLNIPFTLSFVIPMSLLVTVLLHFGRLSSDGEITAMKSCGVSLWQVAAPILLCAIVLSGICFYINANLSPRSHFVRRQMLRDLGVDDPLALLDEGRFVSDFPGVSVYIGKRSGPRIEDVILLQLDKGGVDIEWQAPSGQVMFDPETKTLNIELEKPRRNEYERDATGARGKPRSQTMPTAERTQMILDLSEMMNKSEIRKKDSDMILSELVNSLQNIRQVFPDIQEQNVPRLRSKMAVEASQRMALAMSCFAFALVGIPLGIRAHRKESSIGIGMALVVFCLFYMFIILSDAMVDYPQRQPELIPWIPVLGCQVIGFFLLHKNR